MRILGKAEFDKLKPAIDEMAGQMPDPFTSIVVVEEDEAGNVVLMGVLQSILHLEPVWIASAYRQTGLFNKFISFVRKTFPSLRYLVSHTADPKVATMMAGYGWHELKEQRVFIWRRK